MIKKNEPAQVYISYVHVHLPKFLLICLEFPNSDSKVAIDCKFEYRFVLCFPSPGPQVAGSLFQISLYENGSAYFTFRLKRHLLDDFKATQSAKLMLEGSE